MVRKVPHSQAPEGVFFSPVVGMSLETAREGWKGHSVCGGMFFSTCGANQWSLHAPPGSAVTSNGTETNQLQAEGAWLPVLNSGTGNQLPRYQAFPQSSVFQGYFGVGPSSFARLFHFCHHVENRQKGLVPLLTSIFIQYIISWCLLRCNNDATMNSSCRARGRWFSFAPLARQSF